MSGQHQRLTRCRCRTDLLARRLVGWLLLWLLILSSLRLHAGVVISEFVAANSSGLQDADGDTSDWIEIQNATGQAVALAGWRLTDDAEDLGKWQFPATNLPPGGFLIVFASGKDRAVAGAPLHTSFSLSAAGEYLALVQPDGVIASEYAPAFPPQLADVSYGLTPTNAAVHEFFAVPTPGATNSTAYYSRAVAPSFSPERGFYTTNISVTLTSATPGAEIRWTMDGSPPSATNGFAYTNALVITNTTTLRAAAFAAGTTPSAVGTHSYIFLQDVVRQSPNGAAPPGWPATWGGNVVDYGMDPAITANPPWAAALSNALTSIPTISVVLPLNSLFNTKTGIYAHPELTGLAAEREASFELINPAGDTAKEFQINAGLRIRGGFSRSLDNPKHSFRVLLRPEYGVSRLVYPFFGPGAAGSFDKFDLRSNQDDSWHFTGSDGEILRDAFSRDSQLALGRVATHGNYYHLYLNGQYWGLYTSEERPESTFGESYFGGAGGNYDVIKVDADSDYTITTTDGNLDAWQRLWQAAVNGLSTAAAYQKIQGNNPDGTRNPAFENLLDVPALIDYMLVILYTGNLDAPISSYRDNYSPNNWYALRDRTGAGGGFRFVVHDSENSLYNLEDDRTGPFPAGDPLQGSGFPESNPQFLWQELSANPEFRVQVGDRVQRHFFTGGAFTPGAVTNRYGLRRAEIDRAVIAESARWGDAKREPPFTYDDWRAVGDGLVSDYFPYRTAVVLEQLRAQGLYPNLGAPVMNQLGGAVPAGFGLVLSHTNTGGAIFYTLDGSDPRVPITGAVAASAMSYLAPVALNSPALVRARVLRGLQWSALVEAAFYPPQDLSALALSEIMYHAPDVGATNGDEFDFLELQNTGGSPLNLSGLSFTAGITFTFPNGVTLAPGGFLVLARNAAAMAAKYPGVPIAGIFTGKLDNGGETLTLSHPLGSKIFSVTYDDQPPWPVTPDGRGFSLVQRAPGLSQAPDKGRKWRASAQPGGSPGAADSAPNIPEVVINEILTHTDLPLYDTIELFNPAGTDADIGGWYLSDDAGTPKKYRIPISTIIPAGGYVCFDALQFDAAAQGASAFGLSSAGDEVYLFSADASGNLTGYNHGVMLGAAFNGVSFGRTVNSAGEEFFPLQAARTFGAANAGPRVGPVVINEINYHPDAGGDEFVELVNCGADSVPLFDPVYPTNTWKLAGLGYTFPANVTLGPGQMLLLVATNPASFRAKYGVSNSVIILGPFVGALDNSGEALELQQPDSPNTNEVPYVTVDSVHYGDNAPWPPGADGSGLSLQRRVAPAWGEEPANWLAAGPTPGGLPPGGDSDNDGLPDAWEQANGMAVFQPDANEDPDGDGFTNLQEYLAGTNPRDAADCLKILSVEALPAGLSLYFQAAANHTYGVLYKTSFTDETWNLLESVPAQTTNRLVTVLDACPVNEPRFYRLITPAP